MWQCLGNANQRWSISPKGEIKFGPLSSNKCLTVADGSTSDGTPLQISACGLLPSQRFLFPSSGTIRCSGKCLDVQAALNSEYLSGKTLPEDGAPMQLWPCLSEQLNQKWNFSGPIKARGKCLDRPWATDDNGVVPWTWDCNGTDAQTWDYYFK